MAKMLLEHDHEVTVLDNLSTGHGDAVENVSEFGARVARMMLYSHAAVRPPATAIR